VVPRAEFALKPRHELTAGRYEHLGVVVRLESARRGPPRQRRGKMRVPPSEVGKQAVTEFQCLRINLDVVGTCRLRERRSSPDGHQLDPASRCWPSQQFLRSHDNLGLDLLSGVWMIVQSGRQAHKDPQVPVVPDLPIGQPEFGDASGGTEAASHDVACDSPGQAPLGVLGVGKVDAKFVESNPEKVGRVSDVIP
jgi:hypothetical protein